MKLPAIMLTLALSLACTPAYAGAGMIIESIKAQLEQHGGQIRELPVQPVHPQRQQPPPTMVEQLRLRLLQALGLAR